MPLGCGCESAPCACVVVSSDESIRVTGAGSQGSPYDVSMADASVAGSLRVQDSSTVDLQLDGEGSAASPFELSMTTSSALGDLDDVDASDTTTGFVLGRDAGGDFAMQAPVTYNPDPLNTNTDASIDGDGSGGTPLSVHDYASIAWLSGADNEPNLADLRLGEPGDPSDNSFRISRRLINSVDERLRLTIGTQIESNAYALDGQVGIPELSAEIDSNSNGWFKFSREGRASVIRREGGELHRGYLPLAMWADEVSFQLSSIGNVFSEPITFPADYFSEEPIIIGTITDIFAPGWFGDIQMDVRFDDITSTGATLKVQDFNGGANSTWFVDVSVVAYQFLPAT